MKANANVADDDFLRVDGTAIEGRTAAEMLSDLGAQASDAELTAVAGLTSAANKGIQFTGSGTAATYDLTAAGKTLLDDADAAAQRTTLGVAIGSDVQAYDAELAAVAGLTSAADKGIQFTGSGSAATYDLTAAGKALLDDANAAAQLVTLGVTSTVAELNIMDGGTSASSTTIVDADRVILNDNATMKQVAVTDIKTYVHTNTSINDLSDGKANDTNFSNSILIGQSTTGTLDQAQYNVGLGYGVFDALTSGDRNMGIGYNALNRLTQGSGNIAMGGQSFTALTTGSRNVAIGRQSGRDVDDAQLSGGADLTTGEENTYVGAWTQPSASNVSNETVIGSEATGKGANTVVIGNPQVTQVYASEDAGATLFAAGLNLGGTNVTSTAAELNIMDGGTSATSTTIVDADRVVLNDDGTMKQVTFSDIKTYVGSSSNAATATALATARNIGGVSFDGSADINLPGVNTAGNQNTSGSAATVTGAAQTNITSLGTLTALTVDNLGVDGNTITANSGAVNITPAAGSAIVLDGTVNVDAGVVTGATSITSTAFVGNVTGNVTGNTSGTAATVTGAAQTNITSLGTLTALTVDNVAIDGATIGHTGDTDLLTLASGIVTVAGEASVTTLDIGGTNVTSTAAELNILDASASNSVSSDGASSNGNFTSNNYKISHTFTIDGNLADGAVTNDITITNDKVLATSVIITSASINVNIDVHTVVTGSFKVRITNKSGAQLNDNSTIIINYIVL
ncbi:MAG: hypothetical protein P8L24_00265, partial [Cytophagales bacterium]|nr:hypothetical protein [Cytophagales bacterium]